MAMILARHHFSDDELPSVHAWKAPDIDGLPYRSACGQLADDVGLERVERFTGAPCAVCLLAAIRAADLDELPGDSRAALTDETESSVMAPAVLPVDDPVQPPAKSGYHFGVALRGEQYAHLVPPDSVRGHLDGREVVQTLCLFLAWGPLAMSPQGWPTCGECTEIATTVRA